MKSLFLMTSAINTKFGVYSPEQRFAQTFNTINSIKLYAPGADIALIEMAGVPLTPEQLDKLKPHVRLVFDFTGDEEVKGIYESTDNWDIVKNCTEVMITAKVLRSLMSTGQTVNYDRLFKITGRYELNENFNYSYFDTVPDRIVFLDRKTSQFPPQVTGGLTEQLMTRLFSWPADSTEAMAETYEEGFLAMAERLSEGGYIDIEHMMLKFLPEGQLTEIPKLGLSGLLGPNGMKVDD